MNDALFMFSLLGFCIAIHHYWKWPVETTPFFMTSSMMASLYFGAVLDVLTFTANIIFVSGILLLAWMLYLCLYKSNAENKRLIGWELAIFSVVCILLWFKVGNAIVTSNDDFAHWALTAKDMYLTHSLVAADGYVNFKDYPPGTALFQNLFFYINDIYLPIGFEEGSAFFAQTVLLIAAILPLITITRAFDKKVIFFVIGTLIFGFFTFGPGLRSLNVDHVLSAYFGMALASWWLFGRDLQAILRIVPVIICLPIIKATGLFLSVLLVIILIIYQVYLHFSKSIDKGAHLDTWLRWGALLTMLILIFITQGSWKAHVTDIHGKQTFPTNTSIADVQRSLIGVTTDKENQIKESFVDKLKPFRLIFREDGSVRFEFQRTAFSILALLLLSIYAIRCSSATERRKTSLLLIGVMLGFSAYMLGLLLLYLFSFGDYEAAYLASFKRYTAIYLLAWVFVLLAVFLQMLRQGDVLSNRQILGSFLALFVLCFTFPVNKVPKFLIRDASVIPANDPGTTIRLLVENSRPWLTAESKVYFVWQHSKVYECYLARYVAIPTRLSPGHCSLGSPYEQTDVWTQNISPKEWSDILKDYDFLMLGFVDQKFWDRYGGLFKDNSKAKHETLFNINKKSEMITFTAVSREK